MRSLLDVQHRDSLRRILMEGGQGLCRGWLVFTRFQVKMYASEIADTREEKENSFRGVLPNIFLCVYHLQNRWLASRRPNDYQ